MNLAVSINANQLGVFIKIIGVADFCGNGIFYVDDLGLEAE